MKRKVPGGKPRVLPLVRHRDDVVVDHVEPLHVADRALGRALAPGGPEVAFDAGEVPGLASTVLNLNLPAPLIERIGPIHPELLTANPDPTGPGER